MLSNDKKVADTPVRKWPQYLIAVLCNIGVLLFGVQAGWLSPIQPLLQSEDSPLDNGRPLTNEEISWIAALPSVTLVIGTPIYGYTTDKFGRRFSSLLVCIPYIICYIILIFSRNVYAVYAARLLGGFGSSGGFVVTPIYVGETAEEHTRGFLGSLSGTAIKFGMILAYVLGGFTNYLVTNVVGLLLSISFLFFYFWLPESPVYSYNNNKTEQAIKDIKKLRGNNNFILDQELDKIRSTKKKNENFKIVTLFKDSYNLKAMIVFHGVLAVQMLSGYPAIIRYSVKIFQDSNTSFSPYWSAIVLVIFQVISALAGAVLVDTIGRKALLLYSTAIMVLGLSSMSLFMYLQDLEFMSFLQLTPVVSLILFIIGYGAAYGSVPFVLVPDLFIPAARATAATFGNVWVSFLEFVVTKCFPSVNEIIGLQGTFCIFSVFGILGILFFHFFMFETKGLNTKTEQEINSNVVESPLIDNKV